jgi:hypothetical protein
MSEQLRTQRERIEALAREVYTEEGVRVWMSGRNKGLGGESPEALIARGEGNQVEQFIAALVVGAYW